MDQISLFPERHNAGLFSQYYLDEILLPSIATRPELFEFTTGSFDLRKDYFDAKFKALEPIILQNEELAGKRNERQIEDDVIQPILREVLGHYFDVAPRHKGDVPDYVLFPTEENKKRAKHLTPASEEYQKLNVGILDAKAWKQSRKAGIASEANISQIFRYLTNFSRRWGILTDGFRWMLFANKQGIRQDQYIEFNLVDIVRNPEREQAANFRLFLFLFRREAFERGPGTEAVLDAVLNESFRNAEKLQSDLKKKVYEAFEIVAKEYRRFERLPLSSPEQIQELKEASLIFLYRILFLLFGESRLILPIQPNTQAYYAHSLESLIVDQVDRRPNPEPNGKRYWSALQELFGLIHGLEEDGTPSRLREDIGLPAYNGGLFDPHKYTNVAKWKLGDKAIKEVMDLLTKTGEKKKLNGAQRVRVSYRDLGVQHLGNIYEGILENHLILSDDGSVHVVTDKKERKATGSYYTPDYIVDYIVKETLGPLLPDGSQPKSKTKKKSATLESPEETLLRIKVLDPAMGSGHFLIGAIDFLAEKLAEIVYPEGRYTGAELQECRRRIAERSIYGVDLNPMAVELAKLSIWLHTISNDKPLTFLDNHIKWGNALIGARLSDLDSLPAKKKKKKDEGKVKSGLFPKDKLEKEVPIWLAEMRLFEESSHNIEEVKAKKELERELDERRNKYRHLADLWTASYFLDPSESDVSILFRQLADTIVVNADEESRPKSELLDRALDLAKEKRFFHWELEFPEVFFEENGSSKFDAAGFDAVIGNPPYVPNPEIPMADRPFLRNHLETGIDKLNLFALFIEQGIKLLRARGIYGQVVSNSLLNVTSYAPLRRWLLDKWRIIELLELGARQFKEATIENICLVCLKDLPNDDSIRVVSDRAAHEDGTPLVSEQSVGQFRRSENSVFHVHTDSSGLQLHEKLTRLSLPLGKVLDVVAFGLNTIDNSKYITELPKSPDDKAVIAGRDISRYCVNHIRYVTYRQDLLDRKGDPKAFETPEKIVIQDIASRFVATIDRDGLYVLNTLKILLRRPGVSISLPFALTLLHSRLIDYDFGRSINPKRYDINVHVTRGFLDQIPIRRISFTTPKKEREKLTKSLISQSEKALSADEPAEQVKRNLLPVVELAKQYSEAKNDVLHDFLSHLAEQMLTMNKEKQSLADGFFEWMGHYGIPPRHEMKPKTLLDEFWKLEFKTLLAHLKKNKVPLPTSTQNDLLDRFTIASHELNALESRIRNTDWLIDMVVYALYGLTDEEIQIVERA